MSEEILTDENLKKKFDEKLKEIQNRISIIFENSRIDENIENHYNLYMKLEEIDIELDKIEGNLDINKIDDMDEKEKIINQKVLKLFQPYILYFRLCLMSNSN